MMKLVFKSNVVFFLLTSLLAIAGVSCNRPEDPVPYVPVNFTIYLADPEYSALNSVGNHLMVSGGYNGIIIYRMSIDEFVALERTCTYQPRNKCEMYIDDSDLFVVCECCESSFLIIDGSISDTEKPAEYPLTRYHAEYSEMSNTLTVTN